MNNCIANFRLTLDLADPLSASVLVEVQPEHDEPGLEVRGRLMGPQCAYASTIEVAYPFRPHHGPLTLRTLIPEASLWHPTSPHLYHGPLELWHAGQCLHRTWLRLGLRTFQLSPQGLHINGRLFPLLAQRLDTLRESEAPLLRAAGINTLITSPTEETLDQADRFGFLILSTNNTSKQVHPSHLGILCEDSHPHADELTLSLADSPLELLRLRVMLP
jgi:hypothetical protein